MLDLVDPNYIYSCRPTCANVYVLEWSILMDPIFMPTIFPYTNRADSSRFNSKQTLEIRQGVP